MKLRDPFMVDRLWFSPLEEKWLNLVRSWRNEPRCRTQFHDDSIITHERQRAWFNDVYLPLEDSDVVWVFGDLDVIGVFGQVALYASRVGGDKIKLPLKVDTVTFGRFMIGSENMLSRGYGEAVTRAVLGRAWQLEYRCVDLSVKLSNERAMRLYTRCGFQETHRSDDTAYMVVLAPEVPC